MNKLTSFIKMLSDKIKYFIIFDIVYYLVLIAYDFLVFKRPTTEMLITYLSIILVCTFVFFGVYLIIWIQLKNQCANTKFLDFISMFFFIVFILIFIVLSIEYFLYEFLVATFIPPIVVLGVLFAQRTRFRKYNK